MYIYIYTLIYIYKDVEHRKICLDLLAENHESCISHSSVDTGNDYCGFFKDKFVHFCFKGVCVCVCLSIY